MEPWYLAYALLGATVAGLVPILLPLTVSRAHGATEVGLVMAAVNLGGLTAFLFVVLAWSLLSVSGTELTAELSPVGEGEGMGLFNAATAVAGVIGSALGGWIAGRWGYGPAIGLAVLGVGGGLMLALRLPKTESAPRMGEQT